MCLAIYCPAGKTVKEELLWSGWSRNNDGAGFAWHDGKKVRVSKGFMSWLEFKKEFISVREQFKDNPFIIHFRTRTQGTRSPENTHPFNIKDGVLIHNGGFTGFGYGTNGESDTNSFAKTYGPSLNYDFLVKHKEELGKVLDHWNKLVTLHDNGKAVIINEGDGSWIEGCWFSNVYSLSGGGMGTNMMPYRRAGIDDPAHWMIDD